MQMDIKERMIQLLSAMNTGVYEREEIIALSLLSALAGESIFLLGLPGVGKSMVARRLKMAFADSRCFEYLMSRFSTPDEIFGPVSIGKLKDEDIYERVTEGYLPTADVAFLDEIWKAGPAIQNSLLTVLNEKIFHNGKVDMQLPLKAVISASNELPAEGEGLEAMWDRFLIRYVVQPIADKRLFMQLLTETPAPCVIPPQLAITDTEFHNIRHETKLIKVPYTIGDMLYSIRKAFNDMRSDMNEGADLTKTDLVDPPYVSDRRWRKVVGVLRTSAYLNGRDKVDASDCLLLIHMLWDNDEQINSVKKIVGQAIARSIKSGMMDMKELVTSASFTQPAGEPLMKGNDYLFRVSDEEMHISKDDYARLSEKDIKYGTMTDDSRLLVGDKPTSLALLKTAEGLRINSFHYPLIRTSTLRTGSVKDMLNKVTDSLEEQEHAFRDLVDDNIFLLPYRKYPFMRNAFEELKQNIMRKGY